MRNRTRQLWKWTACAALMALSFAIFDTLMGLPSSDLSIHATWAAEGDFLHPRLFVLHHAHPLWHFGMKALLLAGLPFKTAGALITTLWKGLEFLAVYGLTRQLLDKEEKPWLTALCALCITLVSSLCLPWYNPTVYLGGGTPNTWHSPTQLAVMPLMLVCVPLIARSYDRLRPERGMQAREWWTIAIVLGLSVLAKPTFLQAFVPAAALFFLMQWIKRPQASRYFWQLLAAVAPCLVLMALQFCFYFIQPEENVGMALAVSWEKTWDCCVRLLLMEAFPLFAVLTDRAADRKGNTLLTLALLTNGAAFAEMLLFSETGRRAADGNFAWALMGAALLLWAVALPRFVRQVRQRAREGGGLGWRGATGLALSGWHLASGIYYICYLLAGGHAL